MQRHDGGLDREDQQQQHRSHPDAHRLRRIDQCHARGQIGHVQRSRLGIDRPQREQEQGRPDQVEEHVLHPRLQPRCAPGMDHQAIGGDQQNFEEDKEVEQVAGQKRAHDPHQLELEQRVEMPPPVVPSGPDGIKQHAQGQHSRQQHHQRRQAVPHKDDTERRGPVPKLIDRNRAIRHLPGEASSDHDQRQNSGHGKGPLNTDVIARGQNDERGQQRRQNNGCNQPVGHDVPSSG